MPKGKLIIAKGEAKKLKVVAFASGLTLGETQAIGAELHVIVTYPSIQNVWDAHGRMSEVTGDELKEEKPAK